jgi:hypothetical protein
MDEGACGRGARHPVLLFVVREPYPDILLVPVPRMDRFKLLKRRSDLGFALGRSFGKLEIGLEIVAENSLLFGSREVTLV